MLQPNSVFDNTQQNYLNNLIFKITECSKIYSFDLTSDWAIFRRSDFLTEPSDQGQILKKINVKIFNIIVFFKIQDNLREFWLI